MSEEQKVNVKWSYEFCTHAFSHGSGYVIYRDRETVAFLSKHKEKVAAEIVEACNKLELLAALPEPSEGA